MVPSTLRFGRCVVEPDLRELRLDGSLQDVAPKVFSVLLHLIEHADRVVSKDELLARYWPETDVSESALASAVMKARAAIGDTDAGQRLIQTVHRVGYRFVGKLLPGDEAEADAGFAPELAEQRKPEQPLRLALLPFVNLTGEDSLAWIDLGLMSLVRHALEADARLSLLSVASTLSALQASEGDSGPQDKAAALRRALGADCVVHCELRRSKQGYRLDYQLLGDRANGLSGGHEAASLTQLGSWLARSIESGLCAGRTVAVPLQFTDPLANEALARALEAHEREQTSTAAKLFEVVLDIEPDHPRLCLLAARCIARADPPRAIAIGRALLQRTSGTTDRHFHATAHQVLGHALLQVGTSDEGERHLRRALDLVEHLPFDDDVLQIYAANAFAARLRGDQTRVARLLGTVESASRLLGNNLRLAWVQNNLAVQALDAGRLEEAQQRLGESIALARTHRSLATLCSALGSRVDLQAACGDLQAAIAACEDVVAELASCQWDIVLSFEVMHASQVYAEAGDVANIDRLLALGRRLEGATQPRIAAPWLVAQALRKLCLSQHDEALSMLEQAVSLAEASDMHYAYEMLAMLLPTQLRYDRISQAQATLARIEAMSSAMLPPSLRQTVSLAHAALAHARGDRPAAMAALHALVAASPAGRVPGRARLDLAWLQLEEGDLPAAERTLSTAGMWVHKHPLGLLVRARHEHAAGRHAAAQASCAAALAYDRGPSPPAWALGLRSHLAQAVPPPAGQPPLPRLLSLM